MKNILVIILAISFIACDRQDECTQIIFGSEVDLKSDELICIDGNEFTFIAEDNRCACGVNCISPGEFLLNFENNQGVNVYSYHQDPMIENEDPPFGSAISIVRILGQGECGDQSEIDDVSFTLIFEN